MRFRRYIIENLKLKKVKDPISRLISWETENGKWKIDQAPSRFKNDSKGNPKMIWRIWNGEQKIPQYLPYEYRTLKKAKDVLKNILDRMGKK